MRHKANFFSFAMSQFDWPIAKKSWNYGGSPNLKESMERWSASAFGPPIICEKGRTFGKTYGIKVRCYWEHPWGTHWKPREHIGNPLRTWGEHVGNKGKKKKSSPPPKPKIKKIKCKAFGVHAKPSHWLHEIFISKTVFTIFGLV